MNKFSLIFKVLLKTSFNNNQSKKMKLGLIFAYIYLAGVFGFMTYTLTSMFAPIFAIENMSAQFLTLAFLVVEIVTLLFGIALIIGGLYFAKDYEIFSVLPINEKTYFWAKILKIYLFLAILSLFFVIFITISYASVIAVGVWFVFSMFLGGLIAPLISMSIATALTVLLMPIINRLKKYKMLMSIIGATLVGIFAYYYFGFANSGIFDVGENAITLSNNFKNVVNILSKVLFIDNSLANLILGNNLLINLGIVIASVIGLLAVNYVLSTIAYKQGVRYALEVSENINKNQLNLEKNTFLTLLKREWLSISRYPSLFIYCAISVILTPILVIMMGGSMSGIVLNNSLKALEALAVVVFFGASMQMLSISAFTREGENLYTLKALPISLKKQAWAKVVFAIIPSIFTSLISSICGVVTFNLAWYYFFLIFILGSIISVALVFITTMVDAKAPRLHYDTIYSALQNHPATIFALAINSALIVVVILLFLFLTMVIKIDIAISFIIIWIFITLYAIILLTISIFKFNKSIEDYLNLVE